MRIWTVHPQYLDAKGLVALWRETLLAQRVLQGNTKGYSNHPQLTRFKAQVDPVASVAAYLKIVHEEAVSRRYNFDFSKIALAPRCLKIKCSSGQLLFEWTHLQSKLKLRDPKRLTEIKRIPCPEAHPLFDIVDGHVEAWEVLNAGE